MAPSNKCTLMALLVAFAVVAPSLPPSAATRDGVAKKAAADEVLHPTWWFNIPDIPFIPRVLPCPPVFPKIPFIPCYNLTPPSPPVEECRSSLTKMMPPCAGFLTNSSVTSAPHSCCVAADHVLGSAPYCLCHVVNGDANQLLPAPANQKRAFSILEACFDISSDTFSNVCNKSKDIIPPMDLPTPPPSA
ncbi:hypothetical protein BS78_02G128000 [Paspalum vaginatum]|nr:hypothetical protein BS78_02G128000 [Paspalum vaginatum]KAJ1288949.1 hypothetical protein BS78_02G128000 [Paspalum vaginatum]